jgi:regulatory protein YycI of two-component signal transduction system YycFG
MNKLSKLIFLLIIILVCFGTALFSQAPNKFSYQAIVRNTNNEILANTSIGVRISILHASPNGLISYQEAHTVTSNANGLINLVVGSGNILSGNMSTIVWHSSSFVLAESPAMSNTKDE